MREIWKKAEWWIGTVPLGAGLAMAALGTRLQYMGEMVPSAFMVAAFAFAVAGFAIIVDMARDGLRYRCRMPENLEAREPTGSNSARVSSADLNLKR